MARWRSPSWPSLPPAYLTRFSPALDWPGLSRMDAAAEWQAARRQWSRDRGYATLSDRRDLPAGPLGDALTATSVEIHARQLGELTAAEVRYLMG